jgi:hypothetical protein
MLEKPFLNDQYMLKKVIVVVQIVEESFPRMQEFAHIARRILKKNS